MPMHPMQPAWWMRAPAAIRSSVPPPLVRSARISREVGLTSKLDAACPSAGRARSRPTIAKSRSPGLAEEPITTWEIGSPATSRTGTTLPGDDGLAISGSIADRSIVSVDVVGGAVVGQQLDPVVLASLGLAGIRAPPRRRGTPSSVAPSSAPMLAMTWRSIAVSPARPGPWYSMIRSDPALDVVAAQHLQDHVLGARPSRGSSPVSRTPQISRHRGCTAARRPSPAPPPGRRRRWRACPATPAAQVWESEPTRVLPGDAEALHVDGVGDAVAGLGEPQAEALAAELQEQVVLGVLLVGLQQVVVDVLHATARCGRGPAPSPPAPASPCVPVASWVSVWSMARPSSPPSSMVPLTRWLEMSFWATFCGWVWATTSSCTGPPGRRARCSTVGRGAGERPEPGCGYSCCARTTAAVASAIARSSSVGTTRTGMAESTALITRGSLLRRTVRAGVELHAQCAQPRPTTRDAELRRSFRRCRP